MKGIFSGFNSNKRMGINFNKLVEIYEHCILNTSEVRTKALLIGIDYHDSFAKFKSSKNISSTIKMKNFLISNKYVKDEDIIMMNDDKPKNDKLYSSRANIVEQFNKLVEFSYQTFFSVAIILMYCGHIVRVNTIDNVYRALYTSNGCVVHQDIVDEFINKLPISSSVFMFIDSIDVNPLLELKYRYNCDNANTYTIISKCTEITCNCTLLNCCRYNDYMMNLMNTKDDKISALEYSEESALTNAFLDSYNENITIKDLIIHIKLWFQEKGLKQIPYLFTTQLVEVDRPMSKQILNK